MAEWNEFWSGIRTINNTMSIMKVCVAVLVAVAMSVLIFFTYKMICKGVTYDREFGTVIFVVPVVVALLMSVIGTDIGRAFSLAGALSIIRYRSTLVTPKNIAIIFFSMGAGFITGCGLYLPAVLFTVMTCAILLLYTALVSSKKKDVAKNLLVSIPESLNYEGLLNEVLEKYTSSYVLMGVGVVAAGTLMELRYDIKIKDSDNTKEFLDALREVNGNFNIQLLAYNPDYLLLR